jgi:hypothetical protein
MAGRAFSEKTVICYRIKDTEQVLLMMRRARSELRR